MPVPIILPKFGFTLETADIVQWLRQEGETVRAGDPICEVTTDKVNMEVEAPEDGTLFGLLYQEGDTVPVTEVIAYLLRPGEAPPDTLPEPRAATPADPATEHTPQPAAATNAARPPAITPVARRMAEMAHLDTNHVVGTGPSQRITRRDVEKALREPPGKVRATPAARRMAASHDVDLGAIPGSGPRGRVQGDDVRAWVESQRPAPVTAPAAPPAPQPDAPRIIRLEKMRKTIATRMQKSFQEAPHIFFDAQIDTSALDAMRQQVKAQNERLSVTAFLVKACAWTLLRHPWLNATLEGDEIALWPTVNVGVAVALDEGLIVPVVHHAERLTMRDINASIETLTERARTNTLHLNDMTDGTFTISNLGMFGVDRFTAIINPPQVAILAVGRTQRLFVPDDSGQPALRSFLTVTLSADHRVVDGVQAANFLADLRTVIEQPGLLAW